MTQAEQRTWAGIGTLVIALCAALLLAGVHALTAGAIERNRSAQTLRALKPLLPDTLLPGAPVWRDDLWQVCSARSLLRVQARGYGGPIEMLVAFRPQQQVSGIAVTRHSETPGIGDFFIQRPNWFNGFYGSAPQPPDAVSGATITDRALRGALAATRVRAAALGADLFNTASCTSAQGDAH